MDFYYESYNEEVRRGLTHENIRKREGIAKEITSAPNPYIRVWLFELERRKSTFEDISQHLK